MARSGSVRLTATASPTAQSLVSSASVSGNNRVTSPESRAPSDSFEGFFGRIDIAFASLPLGARVRLVSLCACERTLRLGNFGRSDACRGRFLPLAYPRILDE